MPQQETWRSICPLGMGEESLIFGYVSCLRLPISPFAAEEAQRIQSKLSVPTLIEERNK